MQCPSNLELEVLIDDGDEQTSGRILAGCCAICA
jgi:hypothetical protein